MNQVSYRAAVATALLLSMGSAQAHTPYLLPNFFDVDKRDHVTVQGSFTEEFFQPEVAMKADDYHLIQPDGAKQALTPVYTRDLTVVEVPTASPGTYRVSTGARTGRTAKAAWVNDDWKFLAPKEAAPAGAKVYDVTSITKAEAYVTRGKPSEAAVAQRNSGLEFHSQTHPNSLFVGTEARFTVLYDGKPLANQRVSIHAGNTRYSDDKARLEVTTDSQGQFAIKPGRAGVYLALTRYRPAPATDGATGVSYTYSLVYEVAD
jgi:uncharacterized GH25 family protein